MTEKEWLDSSDPQKMPKVLQGKVSDRKLRLVACAACRRVWSFLHDRRSQNAIEVAERFADQLADHHTTTSERFEVESSAKTAVAMAEDRWRNAEELDIAASGVRYLATAAAAASVMTRADRAAMKAVSQAGVALAWIEHDELAVGIDHWAGMEITGGPWPHLIREIVGNPFADLRCVAPSLLSWNAGLIPKIAQTVYEERRFEDMPILADALDEAGCTDPDILNHCRQPGEHVRGCWVVDFLLGKK
jgi:hypothetical protein